MSIEKFKILYNVNQILKKNFDRYFYIASKNIFYASNESTVKIIELKSEIKLFNKNILINDPKELFSILKVIKSKDIIVFNETENNIEIFNNDSFLNNELLIINSESKRIESIFKEPLLTSKSKELLNLDKCDFINNGNNIGFGINLDKFKEVVTFNRTITNHLICFLELDFNQNEIKLHNRKTDINLDNPFLIFENKYIVTLPLISKKVIDKEYLCFEIFENNIIRINYGNFDFNVSCYFVYLNS